MGKKGDWKLKRVSAEIEAYHASISLKQTLLWYGAYLGGCLMIGVLLKMRWEFILLVAAGSIIFVPILICHTYRNAYEQRRFSDISQYMQQMLYSFRSTKKIKLSLEDTLEIFEVDTPMYEKIQKALQQMENPKEALRQIEKDYPCHRLTTMHNFFLKTEEYGGACEDTIDLLLEDRALWVDRVLLLQAGKKRKKGEVTASILVTILLCFFMNCMMPQEVDVTESTLYQIACTCMMFLDMGIYVAANKKLSTDWLSNKEVIDEKITMKNYQYVNSYNLKKERKKSLAFFLLPAGLFLFGWGMKMPLLIWIALALAPVMLLQHRINYALCMKEIREEIQLKFPRWLMEITLLLQSVNVQKAILASMEQASVVLVPELNRFKKEIEKNPTAAKPYLNFLKEFRLPEVTASMNMLYSLSQGNGGDGRRQIAEIIKRNHKLLDQAEQRANERSLASMTVYFLLPQLVVAAILLVDMVLYLMKAMPSLLSLGNM